MFRLDFDSSTITAKEIIELALQLDVGMFNYLPVALRNPGIAGLCAFRLIADKLIDDKESLSIEGQNFLTVIEGATTSALTSLQSNPQAFIKPLINALYEYKGGFERKYDNPARCAEVVSALREEKISLQAQLVYRNEDGRFFGLLDPKVFEVAKKIFGISLPAAAIGCPHTTLNEGQPKIESERAFETLRELRGLTTAPLYSVPPSSPAKKFSTVTYLNFTFPIKFMGSYAGIPMTSPRIRDTHQLHLEIDLDSLGILTRAGVHSRVTDYFYHVTVQERIRSMYPGLLVLAGGLISPCFKDNHLSAQLKTFLMAGTKSQREDKLRNLLNPPLNQSLFASKVSSPGDLLIDLIRDYDCNSAIDYRP